MPKVVNAGTVNFTNENKDTIASLKVFHCECGSNIISDSPLKLQKCIFRKTDGSLVIDLKSSIFKLNGKVDEYCTRLRRIDGVEHQWRFRCEQCDQVVGYQPVPPDDDVDYVYVLPDRVKIPFEKHNETFCCKMCGYITSNFALMKEHLNQNITHEIFSEGEELPKNLPVEPIVF